jgi:hypothetical protein
LLSTILRKDEGTTFRRLVVRIGHSRAFERQFLPTIEGENPPKVEFFDTVARVKAGLA